MKIDQAQLFINCEYAGISGDMFISALAHLIGIERMESFLAKLLHDLPQVHTATIQFHPTLSQGIGGYQLEATIEYHKSNVAIPSNESTEEPHDLPHIEPGKIQAQIISPPTLLRSPFANSHHEQEGHKHEDHKHEDHKHEDHKHEDHKHEGHTHTHYPLTQMKQDLQAVMQSGLIHDRGQILGMAMLENIIHAEAHVHQKDPNSIHLHELGAVDTILDIVGTIYGLQELGLFHPHSPLTLYSTPIAIGAGTVRSAHGIMPVPAPATAQILQRFQMECIHGPFEKELTTPTGAVILATLKDQGYLIQQRPTKPYHLKQVGIGLGHHALPNRANMLQLYYGSFA